MSNVCRSYVHLIFFILKLQNAKVLLALLYQLVRHKYLCKDHSMEQLWHVIPEVILENEMFLLERSIATNTHRHTE